MKTVKKLFQGIKIINDVYTKWKWRERRVSYGQDFADKTFFVVRRATCKVGLFSYVMTNMGQVDYAIRKGYIPIIDMKNTRNTYLTDETIGSENAWEYYFEQPCQFDLDDIIHAKNVILGSGLISSRNDYPDFTVVKDENKYNYWHEVFSKYCRPTAFLQIECQKRYAELFDGERVLGILARGTDYISTKPKGHPVQPTTDQIVVKCREILKQYSCTKIYLATEDKEIYSYMKKIFKEQLIAPDTKRYSTQGLENINDKVSAKNNDMRKEGEEYLLSIMMLSCCNCLLAGNVGGTHGALLLNKSYDYCYIFDLGNYK